MLNVSYNLIFLELMLLLACSLGVIALVGLIYKVSPMTTDMGNGCSHDCRQ